MIKKNYCKVHFNDGTFIDIEWSHAAIMFQPKDGVLSAYEFVDIIEWEQNIEMVGTQYFTDIIGYTLRENCLLLCNNVKYISDEEMVIEAQK